MALLILSLLKNAAAQDASGRKPTDAPDVLHYAGLLADAQKALEGGDIAQAKARLAETDPQQRGWEFDYLQASILKTSTADGGEGKTADLIQKVEVKGVDVRFALLSGPTRQAAFLCRDGALRVFILKEPASEPKTLSSDNSSPLWSGAFTADGKTFFAGHENGEVVIWDAESWTKRQVIPLGEAWPVRELAVAPDGLSFVAETKTALTLWSLAGEAPKKIADVGQRYNFGEGLAFSPRGDLFATGGMFEVVIHDAKTGEEKRSIHHASYTMGLQFSPDGARIASATRGNINKLLALFDVETGERKFNAGPFPHYVVGTAFTPDGARLVATGPLKDVRFFDCESGQVIFTLPRKTHTARPAVSPDGRLIGWCEGAQFCFIDLPPQDAK